MSDPISIRTAAQALLAPYVGAYLKADPLLQEQVIAPGRLIDAVIPCLRKHKGKVVWRKTAPAYEGDTPSDAYVWHTFHGAHAMRRESDVWRLLTLNHDIGSIEYVIWENTLDVLRRLK